MTAIINLLNKLLDWFIPDEMKKDRDLLLRNRLLASISILVTFIWLPFVFRFGTLSNVIGLVIAAFLLFLPFFLKRTGAFFFSSHALVFIISLTNFYRAYWLGGYDAVLLWWNVIAPVVAVLLVGARSGFVWLAINGLGVGAFYAMDMVGITLPGSGQIDDFSLLGNAIALTIILTTTSFYLERSKNYVMDLREEEVKKSRDLAETMRTIAVEIKQNTSIINLSSEDLRKKQSQMKMSATEIEKTTTESASSINEATNTIQELAGSLSETVKRMRELEHSSLMTEERGSSASGTIREAVKAMAKINESREEYDTILQAITDIADSAHLLSLNAAIEAAKAGEFGKGFFVVVEEIRNLAQRSNDAVVDIRKVIKKSGFVLARSRSTVQSIEDVFFTVTKMVETITGLIRELTSALEEQNIGIKEIAKGTEEIAHSTEENANLIQELKNAIEDNSKTIEDLNQIANQLVEQQAASTA